MKTTRTQQTDEHDDNCTGFNLNTQKLHCLIALDDRTGKILSVKAGDAFFRAFIVEDRKTGTIEARQRFRYTGGDSWSHLHLSPEKQRLNTKERVDCLAERIKFVILTGLGLFCPGVEPPIDAVACFYPPEPDDSEKTLEWLIAKDLVEVTEIGTPDGELIKVSKATGTVN